MISVYVDDFFLTSNNSKALQWLKNTITKKYNMKDLEEIYIIIGWQVTKDLKAGTLKIDQSTFIRNLLKNKNMTDGNSVNIPMITGYFIDCHNTITMKKQRLSLTNN